MRNLLISIYCILPQLMLGQYTYFNNGYLPPYPEIGSGESVSLIVKNNKIFTYGIAPFEKGFGRYVLELDISGNLAEQFEYGEGNVVHQVDFSDTVYPFQAGYVWSGGTGTYPIIIWMDDTFSELFRVEYQEIISDSTYGLFFTSCLDSDNHIVSVGRRTYDLIPEQPGQDYSNLLIAKHDAVGNEIWFHEYSALNLEIDEEDYSGPFIAPRGGIFELNDSSLIVFASVGNDLDCYAFKFDSLGNYVDHVSWGHPTYSDGSAWPVQISENEFMFAYSHPVNYVFDYLTTKPRVGVLNTDDMSVDLFPVLDYPQEFGGITDFEKTPDGDFVILGYGGPDIQGEIIYAYMLRIDTMGEVVWFKTYTPPEFSYELNAYDLEITSDGGFAFVGNYRPLDDQIFYFKTWVVKTDACGDLMDAGCEPIIQISELQNKHETLSVYPNPVQDVLTISYENAGIASLELYDANGRLMLRQKVNDQAIQHYLNVGELPSSLYELRLISQFGATMESVVVIKK